MASASSRKSEVEVLAEDDGAHGRRREEVELDAFAFGPEVIADEAGETEEGPDHGQRQRIVRRSAVNSPVRMVPPKTTTMTRGTARLYSMGPLRSR